MDDLEGCPHCGADFHEQYEDNGQMVMGSKVQGYVIQDVYDGVLYWVCPDCQIAFHRWSDLDDPRLKKLAEPFINDHNLDTLKERK